MNDLNLKVGFDIDRFSAELAKTNSILNQWAAGIQGHLIQAFSVTTGLYLLKQGIQGVVGSLADFSAEMSKVQAITGESGKRLEELRQNALTLGGAFKAIDIAKLETEYGRLGFSTDEILKVTKATVNLAVATGEDLSRSTQIAGSTLRAFGLDASQMTRVTDVMAASMNKSALDLTTLGEAMKYVAPVARAANVSLEETAAMLGILADNGIKGSMAGTSLRRILTDFSRDGSTASEKLAQLSKTGLTLSESFDEVGRTAQTSLLVLVNNSAGVDKLTQSLHNVNGETQKMADIMQDNLRGDQAKFNAALDASIQKGGAFEDMLRRMYQPLTLVLQTLNGNNPYAIKSWEEIQAGMKKAGDEISKLPSIYDASFDAMEERTREAIKNLWNPMANMPVDSGKPLEDPLLKSMAAYAKANPTVNALKASIADLNKKIGETSDRGQIAKYEADIDRLEVKVFKLLNDWESMDKHIKSKDPRNIGTRDALSEDPASGIDPFKKTAESLEKFTGLVIKNAPRVKSIFEEMGKSGKQMANMLQSSFVNMGMGFSNAVAGMLTGATTLAQAIAAMALDVIDNLERVILMELAADSFAKFGIGGFVAVAAAFGAAKALFASIGGGGGGGASSVTVPRAADNFQNRGTVITINGQLTAKGQDLALILSKQRYATGVTGG